MTAPAARPLWVLGDVHGEVAKVRGLLLQAGLLGRDDTWHGGNALLVCIGDYFDRGPDGIGVIELLMRLEAQAAEAGGQVFALLGNHEPLLLAARTFGDAWRDPRGRSFLERWRFNHGQTRDLIELTDRHVDWLLHRPAVVRLGPYLFMHADSILYLRHGRTLQDVNVAFHTQLRSTDPLEWDVLLREFADRGAFEGPDGNNRALEILGAYGGERIVHGHTPIAYQLGMDPANVRSPLLYAEGHCLNVDGGMAYHPAAGFLVRLGRHGVERVVHHVIDPAGRHGPGGF